MAWVGVYPPGSPGYTPDMRPPLLFAVLLSSAVHAQAVRPAPSPGPLVVQQPPTYPGATLTPTGAGASHGGLAAPQKALAPPSPNKRLLPPTKEVGLWAADGESIAGAGESSIFGAVVPLQTYPPHGAENVLGACAADMAAALRTARMDKLLLFPGPVRACMAARAYLQCVIRHGNEPPKTAGWATPSGWDPVYLRQDVIPLAERLAKQQCEGVAITAEQGAAFRAVLEKYSSKSEDYQR